MADLQPVSASVVYTPRDEEELEAGRGFRRFCVSRGGSPSFGVTPFSAALPGSLAQDSFAAAQAQLIGARANLELASNFGNSGLLGRLRFVGSFVALPALVFVQLAGTDAQQPLALALSGKSADQIGIPIHDPKAEANESVSPDLTDSYGKRSIG